jgi:hypothetical protein
LAAWRATFCSGSGGGGGVTQGDVLNSTFEMRSYLLGMLRIDPSGDRIDQSWSFGTVQVDVDLTSTQIH